MMNSTIREKAIDRILLIPEEIERCIQACKHYEVHMYPAEVHQFQSPSGLAKFRRAQDEGGEAIFI